MVLTELINKIKNNEIIIIIILILLLLLYYINTPKTQVKTQDNIPQESQKSIQTIPIVSSKIENFTDNKPEFAVFYTNWCGWSKRILALLNSNEFKKEFDTQRKIESYFNQLESYEKIDSHKQGLYDLISNVILFTSEKANEFHFRFNMDQTQSFKCLDSHTQNGLKELYIDSAIRHGDNISKEYDSQRVEPNSGKKMSWKEYKLSTM